MGVVQQMKPKRYMTVSLTIRQWEVLMRAVNLMNLDTTKERSEVEGIQEMIHLRLKQEKK